MSTHSLHTAPLAGSPHSSARSAAQNIETPMTSPATSRGGGSKFGVHPLVIEIALAPIVWFIAVSWLYFAWNGHIDLDLGVATGFFVMFFTLLLGTASYATKPSRPPRFSKFLHGTVSTYTGDMRGRDVLIEIALLPLSLAVAALIIGAVWMFLR
jgi:hypothetical protein